MPTYDLLATKVRVRFGFNEAQSSRLSKQAKQAAALEKSERDKKGSLSYIKYRSDVKESQAGRIFQCPKPS